MTALGISTLINKNNFNLNNNILQYGIANENNGFGLNDNGIFALKFGNDGSNLTQNISPYYPK